MTELLSRIEAPSDAELISRVRGGDVSAYGDLFSRHVDAARRLGRQLVRGHDVDDLVSEAFAKTLQVLQAGGGPDVAFRAYLLTSLRRLHVDRIRAAKKVQPTDDMTVYDDGTPFQDTVVASFENGAAARAFGSLPERWQLVLWHLEVEGQKPADIAPLLGMSPNSVSALAYRAREGLRQAFLTMHLADCPTEQCRWVNEHLGAYVRKGLSRRDTTKVEEHLGGCRRCTAMYLELDEVNSNLAAIIGPLILGAAAAGYLASSGAAGITGVSAIFGRVRDAVGGSSGGGAVGAGGTAATTGGLVTAGGVIAAGVAAITAAAFVFGGGADKEVLTEADQPVGIVQTPPAAGPDAVDDSASDEGDEQAAEEPAVVGTEPEGTPDAGSLEGTVPDGLDGDSPAPGSDPGIDTVPGDDPEPVGPPSDALPELPPGLPGLPPVIPDLPLPELPQPEQPEPELPEPVDEPTPPAPGGPVEQPPAEEPPPGSGDGGSDGETADPGTDPVTDPVTDPDPDPEPVAFAFDGAPVSQPVNDGGGQGQHRYDISMTFVGVEAGGSITLSLVSSSGAKADSFESSDSCEISPDGSQATCLVLPGSASHSVSITAWLPGSGRDISLEASFNGSTLGPIPLG
jgi:RNA polymerase sigma factor (sigma-70 family)